MEMEIGMEGFVTGGGKVCNEWDIKVFVEDSIRNIEGGVYNGSEYLRQERLDAFYVTFHKNRKKNYP
jgi:hypothetical protein